MVKNIRNLIIGLLSSIMENNRSFYSIILLLLVLSGCVSSFYNSNLRVKAISLVEEGDYIKAAKLFDQIIETEKALNKPNNLSLISAYLSAGDNYRKAKVFEKSINRYKTIINTYQNEFQSQGGKIEEIYELIGNQHFDSGGFDSAITYFNHALSIQDNIERKLVISSELIKAYDNIGEYQKAVYKTDEFLQILGQSKNKEIQATIVGMSIDHYGLTGYKAAKEGDSSLALLTCEKSIALFNSDNINGDRYRVIGSIYDQINKLEEASDYYYLAYKSYLENGIEEELNFTAFLTQLTYSRLGQELHNNGQLEKSIEWYKKVIEIFPEHGNTIREGLAYGYILLNYIKMSKPNEGLIFINDALETAHIMESKYDEQILLYGTIYQVYRSIGDYKKAKGILKYMEPPNTLANTDINVANYYSNLGFHANNEGKFSDAEQHYQNSFKIYEDLGDSSGMAVKLKFLAGNYGDMGYLELAEKYYRRAYDISLVLGDSDNCAAVLSSMSIILADMGKYDHAKKACLKALEFYKFDVASVNNNLGLIYAEWGQYDKALLHFQKSLRLKRKTGQSDIAAELNNIANTYELYRNYDKALEFYKKSLKNAEDNGATAYYKTILLNIARTYFNLGEVEQFFTTVKKYQEVETQTKNTEFIQFGIEMGRMSRILGEYESSIKFYNSSIELSKTNKFYGQLSRAYHGLGLTYYSLEEHTKAETNFLLALEIIENLRKTAKGSVRRDYLARKISVYEDLSSLYLVTGDYKAAFKSIERSRAKFLAEQLVGADTLVSISDLSKVQTSLSSDQAIIIYANLEREKLIELVITNDTIVGVEVPNSVILSTLYPEKEDATLTLAVKSYRNSIKLLDGAEKMTEFGSAFFDYLIQPIKDHIQDKTVLVIVPDGILGYLPFEAFVDKNDQSLLEMYDISYVQSVTVWDIIRDRKYEQKGTLLAVGGAIYRPQTYEVDMVENDKMLAYLKKTAFDSISARGSLRESYTALGYTDWSNLPGSLNEINSISGVIKYTDKISGENATEETIKKLSLSGDLLKYNMLHFATHGVVVSDIPKLSAIVLSQFDQTGDIEDGYLTMNEISRLKINADFVNLSACETGLGKIYRGEGVVGLTQGFILAGANSVSVSLWPIDDIASSVFMESFYTKIARREDYSKALINTKREFISGKYGEKYKKPYYWAPFVYYGK